MSPGRRAPSLPDMKLLIAYDGSADAKAAVRLAARLFDGHTAIVLTVWDAFSEVMSRAAGGYAAASLEFDEINRECQRRAHEVAEEGTGHARAAGLPASSQTARRRATVAETIVEQADELGADVIVLGSRGRTGAAASLLGSVSRAVLARADCPVLVVPAPEVADHRARQRGRAHSTVAADFVAPRR